MLFTVVRLIDSGFVLPDKELIPSFPSHRSTLFPLRPLLTTASPLTVDKAVEYIVNQPDAN